MPIILRPNGESDLANATIHAEGALPQDITSLSAGDYQVGRVEWAPSPVTVTAPVLTSYTPLVADQGAYWTRTGAIGVANHPHLIFAAEFQYGASPNVWASLLEWNSAIDFSTAGVVGSNSFRPSITNGFEARYTKPSAISRLILAIDHTQADFNAGVQFYVDGVDAKGSMTSTDFVQNDTLDWNSASGALDLLRSGATADREFYGTLNFIYFDLPASMPDFSVQANRDKFDAGNINSDGSGVTGSQPLIFNTGDAAHWDTTPNLGSLTGWTKTGAFVA